MLTIEEAIRQIHPSFLDNYRSKYSSLNNADIENLIKTGEDVSNYIINEPGKITLLVGQVQSGKTATYLSVISHLFDKGCNFIVVTPSLDSILLNQTFERIRNTFDVPNVKVFMISDIIENKKPNGAIISRALKDNECVILLGLKNKIRLNQIKSVIKIVKNKISNPILIDDEGDQASFKNKDLEDGVESAIYKGIRDIYKSSKEMSLLTVTASPMPHIFIDNEYDMKPHNALYTIPGSDYLGIEKFMDEENNHIIRVSNKDNNSLMSESNSLLPYSFKESIISFFVATSFVHLRDEKFETQSMLLHINRRIKNHFYIESITNNFLRNIKLKIKKGDTRIMDIIKKVINNLNIKIENVDDFANLIVEHIGNTEIVVVNNQSSKSNELHKPLNKNYIYIGSSMLQRGITIKNLLHTYFTYRGKGMLNADTVLQRARWFGYRRNADLIRVFMADEAIKDFIALSVAVPEMVENFILLQKNKLSFSNFERSIALPYANMKATRDSVIKNRRSKLARYNADYTINNSETAENLFDRIIKIEKPIKMFENQPFIGIKLDNYSDFRDWISDRTLEDIYNEIMPGKNNRKAFEDYINTERPNFFISNVVPENGYRHRSITDGKTISLTQGHADGERGYVGDRYWYKKEDGKFSNSIILQLYKIKLPDDNFIYKMAIVSTNKIHGHLIHAIDN